MKTSLLIFSFAGLFSLQMCSPDDEPSNNCNQLLENWQRVTENWTQNYNSSDNCTAYFEAFKAYYEGGCPGSEYYNHIWDEYAQDVWNNPEEYCKIYDDLN